MFKIDIYPAAGSLCGEHYIDVDGQHFGMISGKRQLIKLFIPVSYQLLSCIAEAVREKAKELQEAYSRAEYMTEPQDGFDKDISDELDRSLEMSITALGCGSTAKVIPLCRIDADWPVEMRPMAGGLNQSLGQKRTAFGGGHALWFLCTHATSVAPKCFRCELYSSEPDTRIPGWDKTWIIIDAAGPVAFSNKELRFTWPSLT